MNEEHIQWQKTAQRHHHVWTEIAIQDDEQVLLFTCYGPEFPPAPPPFGVVSGKVVAGDIIFDTDIDAWVLKDVELEPLA